MGFLGLGCSSTAQITTSKNYEFASTYSPCSAGTCGVSGCPACPTCPAGYCQGYYLSSVCPGAYCYNGTVQCPHGGSPIVIDWDGSGISLTGQEDAKLWTFFPDSPPVKIDWIAPTSTNACLALPEADGTVRTGADLFGNLTPQPTPPDGTAKNGFSALTQYDINQDGVIDQSDAIYSRLRLMQADMSLHTLLEFGVLSISLNYSAAEPQRPIRQHRALSIRVRCNFLSARDFSQAR